MLGTSRRPRIEPGTFAAAAWPRPARLLTVGSAVLPDPIAIAFPAATQRPLVIDLATSSVRESNSRTHPTPSPRSGRLTATRLSLASVVPWGRVEEFARTGEPLHPGWTIGADGKPCHDADEVLARGALMNLGGPRESSGHKGYCLAAMVDILSAVLSGALVEHRGAHPLLVRAGRSSRG